VSGYSEPLALGLLASAAAPIVVVLAEKIPARMIEDDQLGQVSRTGRCVTGLAAILLVAATMLAHGVTMQSVALCVLTQGLLTLAVIDWKYCRLPDVLTLPLLWLGLAASTTLTPTKPTDAIYGAITGY
jgi:hypothetical protein